MERVTRRNVLGGLGGGVACLLFEKKMMAASVFGVEGSERVSAGEVGAGRNAEAPGKVNLSLTAVTSGALRISIAPVVSATPVHELGVVERAWPKPLEQPGAARAHTVAWGRYVIEVKEEPLRIAVSDKGGRLRQEIRFDTDSTNVNFRISDAPLFGLGEGVHPLDRRGTKDGMVNGQHSPDLAVYGSRVPIPWLISAGGWGIFVGLPQGSFDLSGEEGAFRASEATSTRNVFLILGDTPAELLREYAGLTGFPHMPPRWALGFQQSHRTLASKEEVLSEAKTFREKKLPCDAMIYLGTGFCPSGWNTGHGSFTYNDKAFPEPAEVLQQLHDDHFKVILHVVPPGDLHGKLTDTGVAAESPGDAVTYWPKHLPAERAGVDGWWPDEGDKLPTSARLERNQMYWEGSKKLHPDRRPFALHRNGYAGLQRFGWLWSGDVLSTWETLHAQIMIGINVGLSGIPYWGTDTGGFVPTKELTPELFVRWFQFSSFCPSFRAHGRAWKLRLPWGWNLGTAEPKEIEGDWVKSWPPEKDLHRPDVEEICRRYLNLRYQMLPYLYSSVAQTHATGLPLMRSLWIAYPTDAKATLTADQYLWGDSILVAPVHEKDATHRTTYLPAGRWWDFWTNEQAEGGKEVTRAVDLGTMPLYVKAGAIVPIGPVKQYTAEPTAEPVTLRVYPGADGRFTWYDDDGASFRYETGEFLRVECEWNDSARALTLTRDPKGRFDIGRKVRVEVNGGGASKDVRLTERVTKVSL
ncbi:MAG: hypothetical protein NVSMB3_13620 [Acidobacteriaceae bacterium]